MELETNIESHLPAALAHLKEWVAQNSFTSNPVGVNETGKLVAKAFAPLGFTAETMQAENTSFGQHLFLSKKGIGKETIALVAHLDTVYPAEEEAANNFHWVPEGDRIYGPGVGDDKGGIALIWLMLSALKEHPIFSKINWIVALNAAEEHLVQDFHARCRERFPSQTRACLVFEGCGWEDDTLLAVTARKGSANFRISVTGRAAHAGNHHDQGANAIHELALLIPQIEKLTDYDKALTVNVGIMRGGVADNRVAHHAEAFINMRAFDEKVLEDACHALRLLTRTPARVRAATDGFPCEMSIETLQINPSWPSNHETESLFTVWKKVADKMGMAFGSEQRGGLSDANGLWKIAPTLDGLGPAGDNEHCSVRSKDGSQMPEYVLPGSFTSMAALNCRSILQLLGEE